MAVELFEVDNRYIVLIGPNKDGEYNLLERYPSALFPDKTAIVFFTDKPGRAVERTAVITEDSLKEALSLLSDKPLSQFIEELEANNEVEQLG